MGKVARSFNGLPPSVSLNTSGYFGGSPEVSAWNHRSFPNKETDRLALSEEVITKLWTSKLDCSPIDFWVQRYKLF